MALPAAQVELLQSSWAIVETDLDKHALAFFLRIFELSPPAVGLFSFLRDTTEPIASNPRLQKHASLVLKTAGESAIQLGDPEKVEKLIPVIEELGRKHKKRGVVPAHFEVVKQALLDTLSSAFGDKYTPELNEAWSAAFDILSTSVIKGLTEE